MNYMYVAPGMWLAEHQSTGEIVTYDPVQFTDCSARPLTQQRSRHSSWVL